jgi:phage gp46-like protein
LLALVVAIKLDFRHTFTVKAARLPEQQCPRQEPDLVDIPIRVSSDLASMDWPPPSVLAQPLDNSQDLNTYVLMLLATDRVVPLPHANLQPIERRGSWHDAIVGEFGSILWGFVERNLWGTGSKLAQVQAACEQALQTVYDEGLIINPAIVTCDWLTDEAIKINVSLQVNSGVQRLVTYVLS